MRNFFSNGLIAAAGLVSLPGPLANLPPQVPVVEQRVDRRLGILQDYLNEIGSPASALAPTFIYVADQYQLDWRLLPSISVIESEAGKTAKHNNMFGWDNGRAVFPSLGAGIETVARNLANSTRYKDKDLNGVLATYNPSIDYPTRVKSVMQHIAPSKAAE